MSFRGKLECQFDAFIATNPHVYERAVQVAFLLTNNGTRHGSMKAVFEELRRDVTVAAALKRDHCGVRLNNNHHAFMARKIMTDWPELKGLFQLRRQKIQAVVGPPNAVLPSGEHRH